GQAPIQHHLSHQIFCAAAFFDIIGEYIQLILLIILWPVIHIFHIGAIEAIDTETIVYIGIGFFFYFLSSTADAFFSYFTNVFIAGFIGLTFFVCSLWKLYHYVFTITSVLCIELHNGVGCGG